MKSFEHYKKVVFKSAERGLVDHTVGTEDRSSMVGRLVGLNTNRADRLTAAFQLIKEFLPQNRATEDLFRRFTLDPNMLPFDMSKLEFKGKVGSGAICDVYLLESRDGEVPSYVIKIQSHQIKDGDVMQTAEESKGDFNFINDMYKNVPGLVPQEFTLVIENPRHYSKEKEPVVAIIQRFFGRDIRDFFKEVTKEEIVALCQSDPDLLVNIRSFIEITLKTYKEKGILADFFGLKNLSLIKQEGKIKLVMLDPHIIYSKQDQKSWNTVKADEAIEYMKSLQASLDNLV